MILMRRIAAAWLLFLVLSVLWFYFFVPSSALEPQVEAILQSPSLTFWLGTDSLGRSMAHQVLNGASASLIVGVLGCLGTSFLALIFAGVAVLNRGLMDRCLCRLADIFSALPGFLLSAVLCLFLQNEFTSWSGWLVLVVGLVFTHWMGVFRVARALMVEYQSKDWVLAAEALGAGRLRILRRHIWPHMRPSFLTVAVLQIPSLILYESYLSFVGLGVSSPSTSWGLLIKEGWKTLTDFPYLMLAPSFFLFMTIWSIHVLLDSHLQDP